MAFGDRLLCLALQHAAFLRPRERLLLARTLGGADELGRMSPGALEGMLGRPIRSASCDPRLWLSLARQDMVTLTRGPIGCILYGEGGYPRQLGEIYDPPLVLYYRGSLEAIASPGVAVVGTRRPSARARRAARELGEALALAGVVVISGLARGVDAEAHRGALQGGGPHAGVLGNGLESVYPPSSAQLGVRLLSSGGVLLSEYPPQYQPRKHHFPARNRLISALARAVIVVQAPEHSGALITAEFALEQGRDVLVHAWGLEGYAGAGGRALAECGAPVADSAELLRMLGFPEGAAEAARGDFEPRGGEGARGSGLVGARVASMLQRELGLG